MVSICRHCVHAVSLLLSGVSQDKVSGGGRTELLSTAVEAVCNINIK